MNLKIEVRTGLRAFGLVLVAALLAPGLTGCTSRGMTITSVPPGAEVSINRRVVGNTPIRVGYTHYGTYRIELRKERYLTLVREEKVNPPWYGYDPFTAVADNVIPTRINDEIFLHYVMSPVPEINRDSLMDRANAARAGKVVNPRTQEELDVTFVSDASAKNAPDEPQAAPKSAPSETAPLVGPEAAPKLDIPPDLKVPETPEEKPPEGPKAAPGPEKTAPDAPKAETVPTPEPEKKPEAEKKPEGEPGEKRLRRTPKGEVLIYEDAPVEDPGKKKEKK
ncbi:MAG: PEGA domain-containing protein [Planctomycetota bacterium]|nr:PEGA domain-containing protein [Planctomycetota bacterium]